MSWPVKTHIPITDSNRLYYKDTFIWDSSKVNEKFQALKSKFDRTGIPNTLTKDFDGKFDSVEENAIEETFSSDVPESKVCPSLVADVAEEKRKVTQKHYQWQWRRLVTTIIEASSRLALLNRKRRTRLQEKSLWNQSLKILKLRMKLESSVIKWWTVRKYRAMKNFIEFRWTLFPGLKVSFGLDHYGEELNFRHPLLPPPIGHYWDEVFFTDARISEGESPFSFYVRIISNYIFNAQNLKWLQLLYLSYRITKRRRSWKLSLTLWMIGTPNFGPLLQWWRKLIFSLVDFMLSTSINTIPGTGEASYTLII